MTKTQRRIAWFFQLTTAAILIPVGGYKFTGGETDLLIFTALKMEPFGRYLIGFLEVLAGLCLLSKNLAAWGSFLGIGIMLGAILAHTSVLGFDKKHLFLLTTVLVSCCLVLYMRKKQFPLLGGHL